MVTIEIYVVMLNQCFDFRVNPRLMIRDLLALLGELLAQELREPYEESTCFSLGSFQKSCLLDFDKSLWDYQVKEGERFFLF